MQVENSTRTGQSPKDVENDFLSHLKFSLNGDEALLDHQSLDALVLTVRDRIINAWKNSKRDHKGQSEKTICYLSLEFLMGRALINNITNLGLESEVRRALENHGLKLEDLVVFEKDAGLGNGGLGRLAACFLDSLASLDVAAVGYGIRYNYGIFKQKIIDGRQVELPDAWLNNGRSSWEFYNPALSFPVGFGGHVESTSDATGRMHYKWVPSQTVLGVAYDMPIVGWQGKRVNVLRLWSSTASDKFDLAAFNSGSYMDAVAKRIEAESISQVLYPNDSHQQGKMLRLKQQYFFVACSVADIIRRFKTTGNPWKELAGFVSIQLNDTHPAIAIAELMRVLMDNEGLEWDDAWGIVNQVFCYTNHTLLPEALEKWSLDIIGELLPRHTEIIFEINRRLVDQVRHNHPSQVSNIDKISIVEEGFPKKIRMANLAVVGSRHVNGVAEIHSELLKNQLFPSFNAIYPGKFQNVTNGVTQRRWLLECNPSLANLITSAIGPGWVSNYSKIGELKKFASDASFLTEFAKVKQGAKQRASEFLSKLGINAPLEGAVDLQAKRIHEYKRQTMNAVSVAMIYLRLKNDSSFRQSFTPVTVLFAGKAAPGYERAKQTIHLINNVAKVVNKDRQTAELLRVVFVPDYSVSVAEALFPACDISEQISTAGFEASGTGCMKAMMNGAVTLGTLDGANVEIVAEAGRENEFIFGKTVEEIKALSLGYNAREHINTATLEAAEAISCGCLKCDGDFDWLVNSIDNSWEDRFFMWADIASYHDTRLLALSTYKDENEKWNKMALMNVASSAKFSSDRAICDYLETIWKI